MKRVYTYEIELMNMVSGKPKGVKEYESSARLKVGNIYFRLPGLPVGAYHILREVEKREKI